MYRTIYLVDDFEIVNLYHKRMLQKLVTDAQIRMFTDAERAMEELFCDNTIKSPILMFLDIGMPGMGGFEFLDTLVRRSPLMELDVVMVTSSIWQKDRERAGKYPGIVKDFVSKPMNLKTLQSLLRSLTCDS